MYSFVKSEWLKLGGGGGIEGLLVDKCGFARKHFMLGKYRGLQSVLDSWPDPQNCRHFLPAARINRISLNANFPTNSSPQNLLSSL